VPREHEPLIAALQTLLRTATECLPVVQCWGIVLSATATLSALRAPTSACADPRPPIPPPRLRAALH